MCAIEFAGRCCRSRRLDTIFITSVVRKSNQKNISPVASPVLNQYTLERLRNNMKNCRTIKHLWRRVSFSLLFFYFLFSFCFLLFFFLSSRLSRPTPSPLSVRFILARNFCKLRCYRSTVYSRTYVYAYSHVVHTHSSTQLTADRGGHVRDRLERIIKK